MRIAALLLLLLAGCTTVHQLTLMPRGAGNPPQGTGVLNRYDNSLEVKIADQTFRGKMIPLTQTSTGLFVGSQRTAWTNQATALLIGDSGGQVRCEFGFNGMWTEGTGTCVDYRNVTYDLLIK